MKLQHAQRQTPISRGQGKGNQSITDAGDGWIEINSEKDLPKEPIGCFFVTKHNPNEVYQGWYYAETFSVDIEDFEYDLISHYQPIIKPKPPTQSLSK